MTESTVHATIASIVDRKPSTAIFEKNAKVMSKNIPAKTYSFNLNNLLGINKARIPANLNTPKMYIKCDG